MRSRHMSEIPVTEPETNIASGLNAIERETTITASDADDKVRIWTAQRRYISRLKKNPKAVLIREGMIGTSVWAEFEIEASDWNPATGIKRTVNMSEEQRAAAARRFQAMRERQGGMTEDDE